MTGREVNHILVCTALGIGHFTPTCRMARMLSELTLDIDRNNIDVVVSLFAPCREWEIDGSQVGPHDSNRLVYRKVALSNVDPKNMGGMITEQELLFQELRYLLQRSAGKGWPPIRLVLHDQFAVYAHNLSKMSPPTDMLSPNLRRIAISTSHSMATSLFMSSEFAASVAEKRPLKIPQLSNEWPAEVVQMVAAHMSHNEPVLAKLGISAFKPDFPICLVQDLPPLSDSFTNASEHLMQTFWNCQFKMIPIGCIASTSSTVEYTNNVHNRLPYFDWLSSQPKNSVVYVALGTLYSVPCAELIKIATSLEQLGIRSLWAYKRQEVLGDADFNQWKELQAKLVERNLCHFVDWVDQKKVLNHEAIRAFATHCGWNSLTDNFGTKSIPMMCFPLGSEQHLNAAWITYELQVGFIGIDLSEYLDNHNLKTPRGNISLAKNDGLKSTGITTADRTSTVNLISDDEKNDVVSANCNSNSGGYSEQQHDGGYSEQQHDGGYSEQQHDDGNLHYNDGLNRIVQSMACGTARPIKFADVEQLKKLWIRLCNTDYDSLRNRTETIHRHMENKCSWSAVQNRLKRMLINTIPDI